MSVLPMRLAAVVCLATVAIACGSPDGEGASSPQQAPAPAGDPVKAPGSDDPAVAEKLAEKP